MFKSAYHQMRTPKPLGQSLYRTTTSNLFTPSVSPPPTTASWFTSRVPTSSRETSISLSQTIFSWRFPVVGANADLVVPKTVFTLSAAYRFAKQAPRPRVAPIISMLGILRRCCCACKWLLNGRGCRGECVRGTEAKRVGVMTYFSDKSFPEGGRRGGGGRGGRGGRRWPDSELPPA